MKFDAIRQCIVGRMADFRGIDQSRIQYPNQPQEFITPQEGLWCRLSIQYGDSYMAGIADAPHTRKIGAIVIQCFARVRTGIKGLSELADALEEHFSYWSQGDFECVETSQYDVGEKNGFQQMNVRIRFRAG